MNDGGAFYELGASPGTVFSKNDVKAPAQSAGSNFGTYSDEGTRYLTFSQNVFDGWGAWANLNCTDVNETGNITYMGNWGATAGISGQSGCSASSRSCLASYANSGPTLAGNPTNVSVPSLVSIWPAGNCGDVVSNSTEPTSAADAQAVVSAAGLEARPLRRPEEHALIHRARTSTRLPGDGGNEGSTDRPLAEDGGTISCGAAVCNSSEVCLVPLAGASRWGTRARSAPRPIASHRHRTIPSTALRWTAVSRAP